MCATTVIRRAFRHTVVPMLSLRSTRPFVVRSCGEVLASSGPPTRRSGTPPLGRLLTRASSSTAGSPFSVGGDGAAEERRAQHEALMHRLTEPRDPEGNILLHEVWEPWARKTLYTGDNEQRFFRMLVASKEDLKAEQDGWMLRNFCIMTGSYAIPCPEALTAIAEVSSGRVVEVGSGSGYWAKLLQARGVDIVAVDNGEEKHKKVWFPETVVAEGVQYLREHDGCADRALFMCWPRGQFGDAVLSAFKGRTLIWIGEPPGMSTWYLDAGTHPGWEMVREVEIPVWPIVHDVMRIYRRLGTDNTTRENASGTVWAM